MKTKAEIEDLLDRYCSIRRRCGENTTAMQAIHILEWVLSPSEKQRKKAKGRKAE